MNIESALTSRGSVRPVQNYTPLEAGTIKVALDLRLYLRYEVDEVCPSESRHCSGRWLGLARKISRETLPGYTHLQRAQPVLFAHHLLAYIEMLERDRERLVDGRRRINRMPLGSGAIAGSTIQLDRELMWPNCSISRR